MNIKLIRDMLNAERASLRIVEGDLIIQGPKATLKNDSLINLIKGYKQEIIQQIRNGVVFGITGDVLEPPPNLIAKDCSHITPALLPLIDLAQDDIDRIVDTVPGGTGNVQDIYPLAPLQEGVLFHHLIAQEGDPYLLWSLLSFRDRAKLDEYVSALNKVIARHDILRTAVVWEGLAEPVQVVWREASLIVKEIVLDPTHGDISEQLKALYHPRTYCIDIRQAPLMELLVTWDSVNARWVAMHLTHHLALDHTTADVMETEIRAHMAGRGTELPKPAPFRNFVAHLRLALTNEDHESFFRGMLGEVDQPTAPFGLMEVHGDGSKIAEARSKIGSDLSSRLRNRAKLLGVSAASIFHVAWALVLARTSDRESPVFGTVVSGRVQGGKGTDRVLGPFINTVPVLIRLSGLTTAECVCQTHKVLAQLLLHEHAPLVLTQQCSKVPTGTPLFTALLNYRHNAIRDSDQDSAVYSKVDSITFLAGDERNNYPITLTVDDVADDFYLDVQVPPHLGPDRICELVRFAIEQLIHSLETTPSQLVDAIEILPSRERHRLLTEWNKTSLEYPRDRCIHHLFEKQALRTPNNTAIIHGDRLLTYQDLDELSNQLAHRLVSLGIKRDTIVGLCMDRSLEMAVGIFGIFKAGGAYLPLDQRLPTQRLAFMLQDANVSVILTDSKKENALPHYAARVLALDHFTVIANEPKTAPIVAVSQDDLAYVIYTSGSTGRPKGVLGVHRAIVNRLSTEQTDRSAADRIYAQKTTISFIDSMWELFTPLISGGICLLISHDTLADPICFLETVRSRRVTHLVLVPSLLNEILTTMKAHSITLPDLRYCSCSGEPLSSDLARKFLAQLPHAELVNIYGTSEFWDATSHRVTGSDAGSSVPIGRPMPNMKVYVLDKKLALVPVGVIGDLYVSGAGLARGYLNAAPSLDSPFIDSPFELGQEIYRTGDRVRWRIDGELDYVGRSDSQVKRRGFRIEPGEVESVLRSCPGVSEAVVIPRKQDDDVRLVAYVVKDSCSNPLTTESLRMNLIQRLPDFMVPDAIVSLDAIPLTPSGKVDRQMLPVPGNLRETTVAYAAPRNRTEEILANIWASVLKIDRVGVNDDFFEVGGNSIMAIRMINQAKKALGIRFSIKRLFERRTVAALCESASQGENSSTSSSFVLPIVTKGEMRPLFCVHAVAGTGAFYGKIAKHADLGRPIYALEYPGAAVEFQPSHNLEDLAATYVETIRTIQPKGPYNLLGWSFGGHVAFEMACQLQATGELVENLWVLSAGYTDRREGLRFHAWSDRKALGYLLELHSIDVSGVSNEDLWTYALQELRSSNIVHSDYDIADLRRTVKTISDLRRRMNEFRPKRYNGSMYYICATESEHGDAIDKWARVISGHVNLYNIPCTHTRLFDDEWVPAIAEALEEVMGRQRPSEGIGKGIGASA